MGDIGASLQRKVGPLPVWVWAILAGVIVYWIRNRNAAAGGGAASDSATLQQQQAAAAAAATASLQTPVTLGPGESVYDPNTGVVTTPGTPVNNNQQTSSLFSLITVLATVLARRSEGRGPGNPPKGGRNRPTKPKSGRRDATMDRRLEARHDRRQEARRDRREKAHDKRQAKRGKVHK